MTTQIEISYHQRIEEHFIAKRNSGTQISTLDVQCLDAWHNDGIPVEIVIRVINRLFEKRKDITSLRYFDKAVREEARRSAPRPPAVDSAKDAPDHTAEQIHEYLESVLGAFAEALPKAPEPLAETLQTLGWRLVCEQQAVAVEPLQLDKLQERLTAYESELIAAARQSLGQNKLDNLKSACESILAPYRRRQDLETYAETLRAAMDREIAAYFSLPRLSLFYMG